MVESCIWVVLADDHLDHLEAAELLAPFAGLPAQSVKIQPAAENCNGAATASKLDTPSPCGSQRQGDAACRHGQESAHEACSSQRAPHATAHPLPATAMRKTAPEGHLHVRSRNECHQKGSTEAASQTALCSSSAVTTGHMAPSKAGLSSGSSAQLGLQDASQALEAAMTSGNVQQLAAGIHAAVKALSVGSGTAAELPHVTKVSLPSVNFLAS